MLGQVDRARVGALVGDASWGVMLDLALAEIAVAERDMATVRRLTPLLATLSSAQTPPFERRRYAAVASASA